MFISFYFYIFVLSIKVKLNKIKMRVTNKNTGLSFILSPKESADFFYAKNAKGEFINPPENYTIKDESKEISQFQFYLMIISFIALGYASIYLFLHLNY